MPSSGSSPFRLPGEPAVTADGAGGTVVAAAPQSPSNAPTAFSGLVPNVYVVVEVDDETGGTFEALDTLNWSTITLGRDGTDTTARLYASLDAAQLGAAGTLGTQHFVHLMERIKPHLRVRILQASAGTPSANVVWFEGFPLESAPSWNERDQRLEWTCYDVGQHALRHSRFAQVLGRWMRVSATDPEPLTDLAFSAYDSGNDKVTFDWS